MSLKKISYRLQQIHQEVFPILAICVLLFSLVEEFRPGFFTFYISPWWLMGPFLLSALFFFLTPPAVLEQRKPDLPLGVRIGVLFLLLVLARSTWQHVGTGSFSSSLEIFAVVLSLGTVFLVALLVLFSTEERQHWGERIRKFFFQKKSLLIFCGSLIFCMLVFAFFVAFLRDPYFWSFSQISY